MLPSNLPGYQLGLIILLVSVKFRFVDAGICPDSVFSLVLLVLDELEDFLRLLQWLWVHNKNHQAEKTASAWTSGEVFLFTIRILYAYLKGSHLRCFQTCTEQADTPYLLRRTCMCVRKMSWVRGPAVFAAFLRLACLLHPAAPPLAWIMWRILFAVVNTSVQRTSHCVVRVWKAKVWVKLRSQFSGFYPQVMPEKGFRLITRK